MTLANRLYRAARPLRRSVALGRARWIKVVPARVAGRLDLADGAVTPLKVEIGPGRWPTPGYVHVDQDPGARHLEYLAPAWKLPFATGSVNEIRAVHVLEHVHAGDVDRTLREWRRVLVDGGVAQIHVPNFPAIAAAYVAGDTGVKWALSSAIYGGGGPEIRSPEHLSPATHPTDHKVAYDWPLLESVLVGAGFSSVQDVSSIETDHHVEGWRGVVEPISIIVRATK